MRAASSVDDVLADPIGASFTGKSFLVWFQPGLAGSFAFGRFDPDDAGPLRTLMSRPVLAPRYDIFCDLGAVEQLGDPAFALLASFFAGQIGPLVAQLRRFALVRPSGLAGAGIAGLFYENIQPVVEAGLLTDRSETLAWLGHGEESRERIEIEELITSVHAVPPTLRALRGLLPSAVAGATIGTVAKSLGMSARSLQRDLAAAKTSFRDELIRARVRTAESLLTATDLKIEAIARQLGFASVPAFTAMFRRISGETPQDFRRRRSARG